MDGFGGGASALRPGVRDEQGSRTSAVRQPRLGGPRDSCAVAEELGFLPKDKSEQAERAMYMIGRAREFLAVAKFCRPAHAHVHVHARKPL